MRKNASSLLYPACPISIYKLDEKMLARCWQLLLKAVLVEHLIALCQHRPKFWVNAGNNIGTVGLDATQKDSM